MPLIAGGLERNSNIEVIQGIYPAAVLPPPSRKIDPNEASDEKLFERLALLDHIYFAYPMKMSMNSTEKHDKGNTEEKKVEIDQFCELFIQVNIKLFSF